jgi:hypothetical protein
VVRDCTFGCRPRLTCGAQLWDQGIVQLRQRTRSRHESGASRTSCATASASCSDVRDSAMKSLKFVEALASQAFAASSSRSNASDRADPFQHGERERTLASKYYSCLRGQEVVCGGAHSKGVSIDYRLNVGRCIRSVWGTLSNAWPSLRHSARPPTITNVLNPRSRSRYATRALVASRGQVQ